jgi:hypothetical protein
MLEQRARVRAMLYESLKFSWTSDMIDSSVPDDETNLIDDDEQRESDDDQLMVTSNMQMFCKKDDEQLEANDVERKPTVIFCSIFVSNYAIYLAYRSQPTDCNIDNVYGSSCEEKVDRFEVILIFRYFYTFRTYSSSN